MTYRQLTVELWTHGKVPVLCLTGPVDPETSPLLMRTLVRMLSAYMPPRFVVDLTSVTSIDATGWEALVSASRHATESGGRLIIAGVAPRLAPHPALEIRMITDAVDELAP